MSLLCLIPDLLTDQPPVSSPYLIDLFSTVAAAQRIPCELLPELLADLGPLLLHGVVAPPATKMAKRVAKPAKEQDEGGVGTRPTPASSSSSSFCSSSSAAEELNLRAASLQALFIAIYRCDGLLAYEQNGFIGVGGFTGEESSLTNRGPPLLRFVADVFGVVLEGLRDGSEAVRLNSLKVVMALTSKVPDLFSKLPGDAEGGLLQLRTRLKSMVNVETDPQIQGLSGQLYSVLFEAAVGI